MISVVLGGSSRRVFSGHPLAVSNCIVPTGKLLRANQALLLWGGRLDVGMGVAWQGQRQRGGDHALAACPGSVPPLHRQTPLPHALAAALALLRAGRPSVRSPCTLMATVVGGVCLASTVLRNCLKRGYPTTRK